MSDGNSIWDGPGLGEEELPHDEPIPQCCDNPRGFVGGTCDNCGGIVQKEES